MISPATARSLPALSEHRWLRFGTFFGFYVVQGFPLGLIQVAFPAWLLGQGISAVQVAAFAGTTGMPWVLKGLSGPLMDRFAYPPMGLRRPWVLGAQVLLALSGCSLWFVHDPHTQLGWLTVALTAMNTLAAIQDVAVDGMAVTVLKVEERARANSFMVGGQVCGSAVTGAMAVTLLNRYGIPAAGVLTTVLVALVGVTALLFRERPGERLLPWTAGAAHPAAPKPVRNTRKLLLDVLRLFILPMSLVLIGCEISYRVLEGVAQVWWPAQAITAYGFTDEQYAQWISTASVVAAVAGVPIGFVVDLVSARRGIMIGLLFNAALYAVLWFFPESLRQPAPAIVAVMVGSIGSQWMFISTVALFMNVCGVRVAATQFGIYMALSNQARNAGSWLYPDFERWFGVRGLFLFMVTGYLVAFAIIYFFNLERHRRRLAELGEA